MSRLPYKEVTRDRSVFLGLELGPAGSAKCRETPTYNPHKHWGKTAVLGNQFGTYPWCAVRSAGVMDGELVTP